MDISSEVFISKFEPLLSSSLSFKLNPNLEEILVAIIKSSSYVWTFLVAELINMLFKSIPELYNIAKTVRVSNPPDKSKEIL